MDAITEAYLGVVKAQGSTGDLAALLPPKPAVAVESEASACSS